MVRFNNYARILSRTPRNDGAVTSDLVWHRWRVFVDEDQATLNRVNSVTYILHPTFPDPVREVTNRSTKFALETTGWGSFYMTIIVRYNTGKEEQQKYFLDLSKKWPQ